jgi:hypothetical protein
VPALQPGRPARPEPVQYHGTVMLAVLVGVVILVLLLLLSGR